MPEYSFCETATAGSLSRWHIRELTKIGRKTGGGADTPALCGRTVAWDLNAKISDRNLPEACPTCREAYLKKLG